MIRLAALILLSAVSHIQTADTRQQISVTVVEVGGNVTLQCQYTDDDQQFIEWHKQAPGFMIQTLATGAYRKISLEGEFNNRRFNITEVGDLYSFTIRNISKEDEATYFCLSGTRVSRSFVNVTFLAVKDPNQQKSVYVKQIPETESVQLGDVMNLTCSLLSKNKENRVQCPDEHSVHWFRAGPGNSHPATIYTHSNRSDKQEKRSCVYSLSKTIQDSSDAGTYYCAVVTCGQILFGDGTKVETKQNLPIIVLGYLLACCLMVITVLIIYLTLPRQHPKGAKGQVDEAVNLNRETKAMIYAALESSTTAVRRRKNTRKDYIQECVYSVVGTNYHNQ